MMENCSYQSEKTLIIYDNANVRVVYDGQTILICSADEFVNFHEVCSKMTNRIVTQSPIKMGWKPSTFEQPD